ncbi:MAG: hypothetical protein M3268_01250 [Acidobacteriota bacterium]|nr:hypothetical protein [Acidobacteriota bacterium]
MKSRITAALCLAVFILAAGVATRAGAQSRVTLTGQITLDSRAALPRYTLRLSFPAKENRPPVVTFSDERGRYAFNGVEPRRYLLEVYQGEKLVYQKVITLSDSPPQQKCDIQLTVQR